jgi:hypothetical protein
MKNTPTSKKPFFARLLETQRSEHKPEEMEFDKPNQTLKYPSDGDEW